MDECSAVSEWEQILKLALLQQGIHFVDRFDAATTDAVREDHVEFRPLRQWAARLVNDPQFACAESPFETVPPLPLDDCWVDLQFVDLQEHPRSPLYGTLAESSERRYRERSIAAVPPEFIVEHLHHLTTIVGDPGIGKTTFLKWLARHLIQKPHGRYVLPLLVPLRRYVLATPSCGLMRFALSECGVCQPDQQERWAVSLATLAGTAGHRVIFLLDGWDEIPSDERLSVVLLQEIDDLSHAFTVVVTTRPWAAHQLSRYAAQCFEICELPPEGVNVLIDCWHRLTGRPTSDADRLLTHLNDHADLRRLAGIHSC